MITATNYRVVTEPLPERLRQIFDALPSFQEVFWFLVSFGLFLVLGPFAAPVALIAIFSLEGDERGATEPESNQ
jgi:hypothetical protein